MSVQAKSNSETDYDCSIFTNILEDYRQESPVSASGQLAVSQTIDGDLDVFSIGTDKQIYHIRRDPSSDTGWVCQLIESLSKTKAITGIVNSPTGIKGSSRDRVFTSAYVPKKTFNNAYPNSFNELVYNEKTDLFEPQEISRLTGLFVYKRSKNLTQYTGPKGICLTAIEPSPKKKLNSLALTCFIDQADQADQKALLIEKKNKSNKSVTINADKAIFASGENAGEKQPLLPLFFLNDGKLKMAYGYKRNSKTIPKYFISQQPLPTLENVVDFDVFQSRSNGIELVAVDDQAHVYTIAPTQPINIDEPPSWPDQWTHVSTLITPDNALIPSLTQVSGIKTSSGKQAIFSLDAIDGGILWYLIKNEQGGYDRIVNLGKNIAHYSLAENADGEINVFAVTHSQTLLHFWYDHDGEWHNETIELPINTVATQTSVYRSCVTVTEASNGAPAVGYPFQLTASEFLHAEINGKIYKIDESQDRQIFKTNKLGQINISYEIENSLYAPAIAYHSEGLASFELKPERDVNTLFSNVTTDQLKEQDPFTNTPVVPEKYQNQDDLKNIKSTLREAMSMAETFYHPPKSVPVGFTDVDNLQGVRFLKSSKHRSLEYKLKPKADSAWMFDMSTGRPVFTRLSKNKAKKIIKSAKKGRKQTIEELQAQGVLNVDWGGLWQEIENGAAKLKNIVVEGTSAAITFVINGIEQVLDFTVGILEQVYDVIKGVLNVLGTIFGTIVGWLLNLLGGLFGWNEIKANRDKLKDMLKNWASDLSSNYPDIAIYADSTIETLHSARENFDDYAKTVKAQLGNDEVEQFNPNKSSLQDLMSFEGVSLWNKSSWLMDKMDNLLAEVIPITTPDIPDLEDKFDAFYKKYTDELENDAQLVVDKILQLVEGWANSDQSVAQSTLAALIDFVQTVIDQVIELIADVISLLFDLTQTMINSAADIVAWMDEEIEVPYFSAFYNAAIGSPFSLMDLVCLVIAIPMTIVEEIIDDMDQTSDTNASTSKTVWAFVLGFCILIAGLATAVGDIFGWESEDVSVLVPLVATIIAFVAVGIGIAYTMESLEYDESAAAEVIFWIFNIIVLVWDLICTILESISKIPEKIRKVISKLHLIVLGGGAIFLFIYNIGLWVEDCNVNLADGLGYVLNLVSAVSVLARDIFLIPPPNEAVVPAYGLIQAVLISVMLVLHVIIFGDDTEPDDIN